MSATTSQAATSDSRPVRKGDHVFLIDGSGYIFRAYFAMFKAAQARGTGFTRSDGTPTGAVMTFCNMLWKILRDGIDDVEPTHLAIIFDHSARSFRNDIYADYKANRDEPPEDLVPQFPLIREAVRAFGLDPVEQEGYEADDLIATYARQATRAGADVTIISGDKDLMQLVGENVRMYDPMPGNERRIGEEEVIKKFGLGPDKVVEVQALAGDSTDNIPGVPGIGVKTAAQLIEEYGDVETLLSRADEIKQPKRRENLIRFADQARISRRLVELKCDVPVEHALDEFATRDIAAEKLVAFCKAMEFTTFTKRVADAFQVSLDEVEADETLAATPLEERQPAPGEKATPESLAVWMAATVGKEPCTRDHYEMLTSLAQLEAWASAARDQGYVAFDTETDSLDCMVARLVGVSLALAPGKACYVPLQHGISDGLDLEGIGEAPQIPMSDALAVLKPLLEDESVLKIGQNLKYDILVMLNHGVAVAPIDDTMLISYALDAGRTKHGMDELAKRHLDHTCIPFKDVVGSGKSAVTFDQVPIDKAMEYAAEDADVTLRLWKVLKPRLAAERVTSVYETLERPLAGVLARMERNGIAVDRQILSRLSGSFAQQLGSLEHSIHKSAGEDFNVASPRQLGEVLFDKMGLPGGKRTKSGQWETRAGLLDDLIAREDLPDDARQFIQQMLEWRQLSKLKSTYTDALPGFINERTGRIHTSYAMAATSTGRLASSEPNLQNIPIRTPEGREIRKAFVAEKGKKLISADYSQIELRVLAHMADIAALKKAFEEGLDIHAMTASEMFGVPVKDMPAETRRRAKAINFGIIYGISAFGLAAQLGIPRGEAAEYIKTYFKRFPGIRDYMEETKKFAREHGYVKTLFGRKAHYEDIASRNPSIRGFKERAAINAPIQGSAADIIRRAMIRMEDKLAAARLNAKMLLQVHDELIFEAPEDEVEETIRVAREVMETSPAPAVQLSVPLQVDARAADNWDEAH